MTATLGDPADFHDDVSYGGTSDSMFSLDYYRAKTVEFQTVLNALDTAYGAAVLVLSAPDLDEETFNAVLDSINEFDDKKTQLKLTAEGLNGVAAVINSLGGRFPRLSIPGTLGNPILAAIPWATLAAIVATAATAITWGSVWLTGLNTRLRDAQALTAATPQTRDRLAEAIVTTDQAIAATQMTPWAAASGLIKWVALGALGFLAYKAFTASKSRR